MSISVKRPFDAMVTEPFSSPIHNNMEARSLPGTPPKRCRNVSMSPSSPPSPSYGGNSPPHKSVFGRSPASFNSPFQPSTSEVDVEDLAERMHVKRKKVRYVQQPDGTIVAIPQPPTDPHREITFTLDQVKSIVAKAVAEKEEQLRAEFTEILREKLAEQFENFTRFNQDYISRQLRDSQYDYMS